MKMSDYRLYLILGTDCVLVLEYAKVNVRTVKKNKKTSLRTCKQHSVIVFAKCCNACSTVVTRSLKVQFMSMNIVNNKEILFFSHCCGTCDEDLDCLFYLSQQLEGRSESVRLIEPLLQSLLPV